MKEISDTLREGALKQWKDMGDSQRCQTIATYVFGFNVDPRFGKIVEKKESGGIRLISLPKETETKNADAVRKYMHGLGWETQIAALPRSQSRRAILTNEKLGLIVETHPMPENEAIRFGSWMAILFEREQANG